MSKGITMANEVDAYIKGAPASARKTLTLLRRTILSAAPEAMERFSYGMPYYHYRGHLAYFGLHTKHIGLYVPPPVIEKHKGLLKEYQTTKATVRFPLEKDLPEALIKKLIKARMEINEQRAAAQRPGSNPDRRGTRYP